MGYLVTVAVIAFGFAANLLVEVSAELSTDVLIDTDAGIASYGTSVVPDRIIDMRPETALAAVAEPAS